jgi:hypothetical protein
MLMDQSWLAPVLQVVVTSLFSSAVIVTFINLVFRRRTEEIAAEVRQQFDRERSRYESSVARQTTLLAELLGPIYIQLDRSSRAFRRWNNQSLYLESKIIRDANLTARDVLLTKAYLLPPELRGDASALIEHYDRWLEEFEAIRGGTSPNLDEPFVFVGPKGYPFPQQAAEHFNQRFRAEWDALYGPKST